jgi:hypothetical protein
MDMIKVEGHPGLYRDPNTGAIINDTSEYDKYLKQKQQRMIQREEMDSLKNQVSELTQTVQLLIDTIKNKQGT